MKEETVWAICVVAAFCLIAFIVFECCENTSKEDDQKHVESIHQMDTNAELAKRCLDNDGVWVSSQCVYPRQPKAKP